MELMSRQAGPNEGGGRCRAQVSAVAPRLGTVSVGESPMGKFCARETLVSVACRPGQRLAPMSKARTNFFGGGTLVFLPWCGRFLAPVVVRSFDKGFCAGIRGSSRTSHRGHISVQHDKSTQPVLFAQRFPKDAAAVPSVDGHSRGSWPASLTREARLQITQTPAQAGKVDAAGARGFGEVACERQHCVGAFEEGHACIAAQVPRQRKGTLTPRELLLKKLELEEVSETCRGALTRHVDALEAILDVGRPLWREGDRHAHAHQGRTRMSRRSLGQTRTDVLARRLRQSRAALERQVRVG